MKQKDIIKKIKNKKATICIMGLGYVGLPLVNAFCNAGFNVNGFDTSEDKIYQIKNSKTDISEVSIKKIKKFINNERLNVKSDAKLLGDSDVIIICVPTPLNDSFEPDMQYINSCVALIKENAKSNTVVILESTSFPGTTKELVFDKLNDKKRNSFQYIAYSPERVDPGNKKFGIKNTPKVIGGMNKESLKLADMIYSHICDETILMKSCEEAEMVKLVENIYRQTNIALVNEMMMISDKLNIDIWNVIKGCSTKPFGYSKFLPGPGTGGHCIPLDPMYLSWKAKTKNYFSRFIDLSTDINQNMPNYVFEKISSHLNKSSKSIKNSNCFIVGVAYKKNVADVRESPSMKVISLLLEAGANINYHDPYISSITIDNNRRLKKINSTKISKLNINNSDIVVILTDHDNISWNTILKNSKIILDTKGLFHNKKDKQKNLHFL
tara:strand:+ start:686 stop:2002 length:1317 start_codon:yes stop_codon:yes gene_type:complete